MCRQNSSISIFKGFELSHFDVITVNYKSRDYALRCMESVFGHLNRLLGNVYLIDNASGEDLEAIKNRFPQCEIICNDKNIGFGAAVNIGLARTTAPYVMIINPDACIREGSSQALLDWLDSRPNVGILGPRILSPDGTVQGSARGFPTGFTGLFGRSSLLSRFFPNNSITRRNVMTWKAEGICGVDTDWVSGAFMVVRREALKDVGLLDERFFMYWEDADWCRRMWQKKWRVVYYTGFSVIHFSGKSSRKIPIKSLIYFHKSAYYLFVKYSSAPIWIFSPLVLTGLFARFCCCLLKNSLRRRIS
jgi:GT2 family glycosyltransferase